MLTCNNIPSHFLCWCTQIQEKGFTDVVITVSFLDTATFCSEYVFPLWIYRLPSKHQSHMYNLPGTWSQVLEEKCTLWYSFLSVFFLCQEAAEEDKAHLCYTEKSVHTGWCGYSNSSVWDGTKWEKLHSLVLETKFSINAIDYIANFSQGYLYLEPHFLGKSERIAGSPVRCTRTFKYMKAGQ